MFKTHNRNLRRREQTLFISAIKTDLDKAARLVNSMREAFKLPGLLKILYDEIKPGF